MKRQTTTLIAVIACFIATVCYGNPIQDPIADYLAMQVPDRFEYVGTPEFIQRVKVDVDGDGTDEIFVGTWYRFSGSKETYYWACYKAVQGGYVRITPADKDVMISSFEGIYAGLIEEVSKQGLVMAYDISIDSPEEANVTAVGNLHYYTIADGQLIDEDRGALNLANQADKTIYEKYFGPERETRTPSSNETFTAAQLQQLGYTIPNWEPPSP